MDEALQSQARHLYAIERLSIRQVAQKLGISRKKAARLISTDNLERDIWSLMGSGLTIDF